MARKLFTRLGEAGCILGRMNPEIMTTEGATLRRGWKMLSDMPDDQLVELARNRDFVAFEALMRRHNRRLFRVARTILRDGLAYDRCQVGVVTDMDGVETLAEFDVHEQDQMTKVMRTQVDVVLSEGAAVLNAAIPQVADLAPLSDGAVVLYAQDATLPVIVEHRAKDNGRAVVVKNGRVVLATGSSEHVLGSLADLTFGRNAVVPDTDALVAIDDAVLLAGVVSRGPVDVHGEITARHRRVVAHVPLNGPRRVAAALVIAGGRHGGKRLGQSRQRQREERED